MKKYLFSIIAINLSFASELKYALHQTHAFPFLKGKSEVILEYQKLNDTLDVLNIKEQELSKSISNYASIGDMDGVKVGITYGLSEKITLHADIDKADIEYGSGSVKNKKYELFSRYNFLQNSLAKTAFSVDVGGVINKANNITYTDINLLNNSIPFIYQNTWILYVEDFIL